MANNCGFRITLYGKNMENMRRVCAIINAEDPEYTVVRTWSGESSITYEYESEYPYEDSYVTIEGVCPWTADYYWRPELTIAGHGFVPGECRADDGRMYVSIPYLCALWGLRADGYEEEWGCGVDGWYECKQNGEVDYYDSWGDQCIDHMKNDPDDSWYECTKMALADGRLEAYKEEAEQLIAAYDAEDD